MICRKPPLCVCAEGEDAPAARATGCRLASRQSGGASLSGSDRRGKRPVRPPDPTGSPYQPKLGPLAPPSALHPHLGWEEL